jgi:hypothetical protein
MQKRALNLWTQERSPPTHGLVGRLVSPMVSHNQHSSEKLVGLV